MLADQAETSSHKLPAGATHLLVLLGDGIGPEIAGPTLDVVDKADRIVGLDLTLETAAIAFVSLKTAGATITDGVVAQAKRAAGVIRGPVSHNESPPVAEGGLNPSGELRKR